MKRFIKENLKYIITYILVINWILFSSLTSLDFFWSYSFSFNIANGLVPYKDFNMVSTPFSNMLLALPLYLFGKSIHIYAIFYAVIFTLLTYLLDKIYKEKGWLVLILLWSRFYQPSFIVTCSYNLLIIIFALMLIYLEKEKKHPVWIGVITALSIFTKQNIGILFLIMEFIFTIKDKQNLLKKGIGFLIPCVLFLIYFIVTKSLIPFIDQAFLGLFNFAKENNNHNFNIYFYLSITVLIIGFLHFLKNKNIENALIFSTIFLSLTGYDYMHFILSLAMLILLIPINIKITKNKMIILLLSIEFLLFSYITYQNFTKEHIYPTKIKYLNYFYHPKFIIIENKELKEYIKENKYKNIVIFDSNSYYYKITNNWKINNYLDLMNKGNYGKKGSENAIDEIKKADKDTVYIFNLNLVSEYKYNSASQLDIKTLKWFLKHAKKIDEIGRFAVYKYQEKKE